MGVIGLMEAHGLLGACGLMRAICSLGDLGSREHWARWGKTAIARDGWGLAAMVMDLTAKGDPVSWARWA
jgi:hypothetical protein